jgi:hypothetical protein
LAKTGPGGFGGAQEIASSLKIERNGEQDKRGIARDLGLKGLRQLKLHVRATARYRLTRAH